MNSTENNLSNVNNIYIKKDCEEEKKPKISEEKIKEIVLEYKEALIREIEIILIIIYDKNMKEENEIEDEKEKKENEESIKRLEKSKNQISKFSEILGSYFNNFIKETLFIKMYENINKCKLQIFEIKEIKDLLLTKILIDERKRVSSPNRSLIKNKKKLNRSNSTLNHSSHNLKIALTTLFGHLRNLKRSLDNSVNDIENIFKVPLSEFPDYNIYEIQLIFFYEIFQNDPLIKDCIEKFKYNSDYHIAIKEIEFGIQSIFGQIINKKFIFQKEIEKKKIKKKIKKKRKNNKKGNNKIKKVNMENNFLIDNDVKIENDEENKIENKEDNEVNNFKRNLQIFNEEPSKKKKFKCNVSKKWLNHLLNDLENCKTLS